MSDIIVVFGLLSAFAATACCSLAMASVAWGAMTRREVDSWPLAGLGFFWAFLAALCAVAVK